MFSNFSLKVFLSLLAWSLYFCLAWQYFFDRNFGHAIREAFAVWPLFVGGVLIVIFVLTGKRSDVFVRLVFNFAYGFLISGALTISATLILGVLILGLVPLFPDACLASIRPAVGKWIDYLAESFGFGGLIISWIMALLIVDTGKIRNRFWSASLTVKSCFVCIAMFLAGTFYGTFHETLLSYTYSSTWPSL